MSTKTKVFIDSIIVNGASLIEKFFFFLVNVIIARYLSIEHFGEFTTALSYATFFSILTDIGINVTLIRSLNLEKQYANYHFTNAFILKLFLAVILYFIMSVTLLFTGYNKDVIYLTLILGLVRFGNEFMKTYYAVNEAQQQFLFPSIVNSLYVVSFFFGVIIVIMLHGDYYHISLVRLLVVIIFLVYLTKTIIKRFTIKFDFVIFYNFISSAIPFSIISILWNFILRMNTIIISLLIGTGEVGIFTNSLLFIDTLSIIPSNLRRIIIPVLYKAYQESDKRKFQFAFDMMSKYFGIIAFYIFLSLFLFAKDIILMIFGEKYIESVYILQILSFSIPFVFNMANIILVGMDKQKVLSYILILSTGINIISNIILIEIYELPGAAFSVIMTYVAIFIFGHMYLIYYKNLNILIVTKNYILLCNISMLCILIYHYTQLSKLTIFSSFPILSILYVALIMIFLINKDDVRIIKEMINLKF